MHNRRLSLLHYIHSFVRSFVSFVGSSPVPIHPLLLLRPMSVSNPFQGVETGALTG